MFTILVMKRVLSIILRKRVIFFFTYTYMYITLRNITLFIARIVNVAQNYSRMLTCLEHLHKYWQERVTSKNFLMYLQGNIGRVKKVCVVITKSECGLDKVSKIRSKLSKITFHFIIFLFPCYTVLTGVNFYDSDYFFILIPPLKLGFCRPLII